MRLLRLPALAPLLLLACATAPPPPDAPLPPEICFDNLPHTTAPAPALVPGEGPFTADLLGKTVHLSGCLEDTGAINVFKTNTYDGYRVGADRLYVKARVLENPLAEVWCEVEARVSRVDVAQQDQNQIEILSRREVDMASLNRALDASADWVAKNRAAIDLNRFKQSERFANPRFTKLPADTDLNALPRRDVREIRGVDAARGIAAFTVARHVLGEVQHHHGEFLDLVVVYDLKAGRIIRVRVVNTGYFLE